MNTYKEINVDANKDSAQKISEVIKKIMESAIDFQNKDKKSYDETIYTLGSLIFFLSCKDRFVFGIKENIDTEINNNHEYIN